MLKYFPQPKKNANIQINCSIALNENSSKEMLEQAKLYKMSTYRNRIVPSNDDTWSILNHWDNVLTSIVAEVLESTKNIKLQCN